MILIIDTSSARSAMALVDGDGRTLIVEEQDGRMNVAAVYRSRLAGHKLDKVAVATGPGSFTGIRVGVSFALGLAVGLRIPIVPLPTLNLQQARSEMPVIALSEAGRGRVYFQAPGGKPALGEPADIPRTHRLVGWVTPKSEAALVAAGHRFRPEGKLRTFAEAASQLLKSAREVPYGSVKLEYVQSFGGSKF